MQTEQQPKIASLVFLQTVSAAVTQLKQKLQQDYERVYPGLAKSSISSSTKKKQRRGSYRCSRICFFPTGRGACRQARSPTRGDKTGRGPGAASFLFDMPSSQPALAYVDY